MTFPEGAAQPGAGLPDRIKGEQQMDKKGKEPLARHLRTAESRPWLKVAMLIS